ncbi:hypothetical protein K9N08_01315 [Candidatus Gracilibacteria bacterium]|nr:hypothetical protein [Candidatus Gracilibacteria bacterium]MCF7856180.1 hypothetical protein [Candidatus Gracilibacteria bacterium]MCF7896452.1 hypothetical protein [Candidatus Gracilibacteria bacterium]
MLSFLRNLVSNAKPNRLVWHVDQMPTRPDINVDSVEKSETNEKKETQETFDPKKITELRAKNNAQEKISQNDDLQELPKIEKKMDVAYEESSPENKIGLNAKTLAEKQKLNSENMEAVEIRENLKNLSTAQIRTLEKTNPTLLFKACFAKNGDELVFDSGGIESLEKGVGLRVLPAEYNHLTINGKTAYRLESGVFEYANGDGYAKVETGKQTIKIEKTPPPSDALAKLNTKTKSYYHNRDLNNFLRAYGGDDIDSNPAKLKMFGEMLASGEVDDIPEDLQASLQNKVEKNVAEQAELAKLLKMTDQEFNEVMGNGGNAAIAFNYLKGLGGLNLTDVQIAGLIGNLQQESGKNLNTTAVGDSGTSYGIAQWHNERKEALFLFAKNQDSDPSSLKTQLAFLVHELKNGESGALTRLQRAQTVEEATTAFNQHFERSADKPGDARHNQRIAYSREAHEQYSQA